MFLFAKSENILTFASAENFQYAFSPNNELAPHHNRRM